mmetsp:Transcript_4062/g.4571  ORF Transcript_4062/g.4571 Transcript_4062/m.4571 type:complete len:198 (-) Transcript_4062:40-633(-)
MGQCFPILYEVAAEGVTGSFEFAFQVDYSIDGNSKQLTFQERHYLNCWSETTVYTVVKDESSITSFSEGIPSTVKYEVRKSSPRLTYSLSTTKKQIEELPKEMESKTNTSHSYFEIQYDNTVWAILGKQRGILTNDSVVPITCSMIPLRAGIHYFPEITILTSNSQTATVTSKQVSVAVSPVGILELEHVEYDRKAF